jgi:hypothetical protein
LCQIYPSGLVAATTQVLLNPQVISGVSKYYDGSSVLLEEEVAVVVSFR